MTAGNPELFDDPDAENGPEHDAPSAFFAAVQAAEAILGRPRGARNKKSVDFEKWFYAKGFKDPAQYLAELYSADPIALKAAVQGASMLEILNLQRAAAGELLPYLHGKKPIDVNLTSELLPTLIIAAGTNQLDQARELLERRQAALSVGAPIVEAEANKINDLESGE